MFHQHFFLSHDTDSDRVYGINQQKWDVPSCAGTPHFDVYSEKPFINYIQGSDMQPFRHQSSGGHQSVPEVSGVDISACRWCGSL